jgi:hypothetical protein
VRLQIQKTTTAADLKKELSKYENLKLPTLTVGRKKASLSDLGLYQIDDLSKNQLDGNLKFQEIEN